MKKVGILYICTGEYFKFWDQFYKNSERYFLNDCELHYFIFTDNNILLNLKHKRIHPIYHKLMDWPFPTLLRYEIFYENRGVFDYMDYLVFCNANLLFKDYIDKDELFGVNRMFATIHPGYLDKTFEKFPYEKNQNSLAYINRNENSKYVCGGFNGGEKKYFLRMAEELNDNTNNDLENDIIAIWHDESHFNYYVEKNKNLFNIIDAKFCYPENRKINFKQKILVQDKDRIIGVNHKGVIYSMRYHAIKYIKIVIDFLSVKK